MQAIFSRRSLQVRRECRYDGGTGMRVKSVCKLGVRLESRLWVPESLLTVRPWASHLTSLSLHL